MLQKQSELDPRSLLRLLWFSHTFESMTLLRLDILAAKTVMTVASHCGRCGGEAVVSTVTNKSSSSPYGFVVIGGRICVQEKFIFLSPTIMGKVSIPTQVVFLMETRLTERVIDSYPLCSTKTPPRVTFSWE